MNSFSAVPEKQYFPALTGLRAVAAYLVFAHHALIETLASVPFLGTIAKEGHAGVTIFFVLSGFLIGLRYSQSFNSLSKIKLKQFFIHRFARLYPAYLLCTIIALWFRQDFRIEAWVINLFMLQGLFSEYTFSGIGVGWSLTVEIMFYLFTPFVLLYWHRFNLLKWVALFLLLSMILLAIGQLPISGDFIPDWHYLIRGTFFGRCFEFLIGVWLAKKLLLEDALRSQIVKSHSGKFTYGGFLGVLLCLFGMSLLNQMPPILFHGINNYLLPVLIACLLWGLVWEHTFIAKALGSRIGEELGKGSYIFYLVHYTFGFDVLYFHVWQNRWGVLLLLAILSVVGYHFVEAPLRKFIVRLSRKLSLNNPQYQRLF